MRTISLTELASKENIQISEIFAIHQYWREDNETFVMNHPRRQSALLWFRGIDGEYTTEQGKRISVPRDKRLSTQCFFRRSSIAG